MNIRLKTLLFLLGTALALGSLSVHAENNLKKLIAAAIKHNPEIIVTRENSSAIEKRFSQVIQRPDPVISLTLNNYPLAMNPFDLGATPMTQTQISIAQMFPAGDTLKYRGELIRQTVVMNQSEVLKKELQIATSTSSTYMKLAYLTKLEPLIKQELAAIGKLYRAALNAFESNKIGLDVLYEIEVRQSTVESQLGSLSSNKELLLSELGYLTKIEIPDLRISFLGQFESADDPMNPKKFMDLAKTNNPDLQLIRDSLRRLGIQKNLDQERLSPDYTLKLAYGNRYDATDFWTAGISFNLPINRDQKQRQKIAETEAGAKVLAARYAATINNLSSKISSNIITIKRIRKERWHLIDSTIPKAEMAWKAASNRLETSQGNLDSIYKVLITLNKLHQNSLRLEFAEIFELISLQKNIGLLPDFDNEVYNGK